MQANNLPLEYSDLRLDEAVQVRRGSSVEDIVLPTYRSYMCPVK